MSQNESHHSGKISLCPLLLSFGYAGYSLIEKEKDPELLLVLSLHHLNRNFVSYVLWQPRMLLTVDENLRPLSVPVRVGQAGRPKTNTGFQAHLTPVLLAAGDRAE